MNDLEPGDVIRVKSFKAVIQDGDGWMQFKTDNGKAF